MTELFSPPCLHHCGRFRRFPWQNSHLNYYVFSYAPRGDGTPSASAPRRPRRRPSRPVFPPLACCCFRACVCVCVCVCSVAPHRRVSGPSCVVRAAGPVRAAVPRPPVSQCVCRCNATRNATRRRKHTPPTNCLLQVGVQLTLPPQAAHSAFWRVLEAGPAHIDGCFRCHQ